MKRSIRKNSEYRSIYKNGQSRASGSLVMYVKDNHRPANRIGITASKKIGNSVVRHKFIRRIREIFRAYDPETVQGKDIIVVARGAAGRVDYYTLARDYRRLLHFHHLLTAEDESAD